MNKKFTNKISIIIPCYNDGKYISEAIESVEKCDKQLYELIIVDDGSNDKKTIEVLNKLKKNKYHMIRIKHQGQSVARNIGAKAAKYHYLLFLDSDNRIYPEYLTEGIRILNENNEVGVVYGDMKLFGLEEGFRYQDDFDIHNALLVNCFDMCCLIRKKVLEDCRFDKNMDFWEDWEFFINAYKHGWKFYHIPKVLFDYRIKSKSVNNKRFIKKNRLRVLNYVYKKHFNFFVKIIEEIIVKYGPVTNTYVSKNFHNQEINKIIIEKNKIGAENLMLQNNLNNLRNELNSIKQSLLWRILQRYQNYIDKIIPKESNAGKKYNQIVIFVRNLFKSKV